MPKYYDILNISKRPWKSNVTLHLSAGPQGYSYHSLVVGGVLKNVSEDQISDQIRSLAKSKRGRPPVIELKEIDYEARQAAEAKRAELVLARSEKKAARREAEEEVVADDLSLEEQEALESGTELPG